MLSYHGDEGLKSLIVAEMQRHKEQDQFIKGTYGDNDGGNFKGCAVGCAINSLNKVLNKSYRMNNHKAYEELLGIPEWLARMQDRIFENLPNEKNGEFAVDFLSSIPVGVDLEPIKWKFFFYLMRDNIDRVMSLNIDEDIRTKVLNVLYEVSSLHEKAIEHNVWDVEAADSAAKSAWSVTRCVGDSAAEFASESAAWAAGEPAAWGVGEPAAWAVARSAGCAADSAAWLRYAEEILRLLKNHQNKTQRIINGL